LSLRKVDSGAFKDLDLKQISLDGVSLEMAVMRPHQRRLRYKKSLRLAQNPAGETPKSDPETRFLPKPGFLSAHATA